MKTAAPPPAVPSPCTGVCRIDPVSTYCEGCLRTIDEIKAWRDLSNGGKLRLWRVLGERRLPAAPPEESTP
ncbi:MAG: DUF1289 domain-containing protein [Pseudomonadota bacterium]